MEIEDYFTKRVERENFIGKTIFHHSICHKFKTRFSKLIVLKVNFQNIFQIRFYAESLVSRQSKSFYLLTINHIYLFLFEKMNEIVNLECKGHQPITNLNLTEFSNLNNKLLYIVLSDFSKKHTEQIMVLQGFEHIQDKKICETIDMNTVKDNDVDSSELNDNYIFECRNMINNFKIIHYFSNNVTFNLDVYT